MVSPMASTCDRCTAGCTKTSPKILRPKNSEKKKTHPIQPEKGETGCVLGAGGDGSRCGQMQTDVKTHCLNQREHHNHTTHVKRKPAETQCFRRFCGRGRRTWSRLPPRSALDGRHRRPAPHDTHRRWACGQTLLPNLSAH